MLDLRDQSEGHQETKPAAYEENTPAPRTRCLRKLWLQGNIDAAGDGREALFSTQLAHAVIGVHRAQGNAQAHNHSHQTDNCAVHFPLLSVLGRPGANRCRNRCR